MERVQELNVYVVPVLREKVLVLRRHDGFWEFPGGSVDWGEGPEQSAAREAREEVGSAPKSLSFLGITSAVYEKEGKEKHSVYLVYWGEMVNDTVVLSKEHSEGRWMTLPELRFLKLGLNAEDIPAMLEARG